MATWSWTVPFACDPPVQNSPAKRIAMEQQLSPRYNPQPERDNSSAPGKKPSSLAAPTDSIGILQFGSREAIVEDKFEIIHEDFLSSLSIFSNPSKLIHPPLIDPPVKVYAEDSASLECTKCNLIPRHRGSRICDGSSEGALRHLKIKTTNLDRKARNLTFS